jgi:hypothetical protein
MFSKSGGVVMPLISPKIPNISFYLRTTKPFHNINIAHDFFQLISNYGSAYRPYKYGNFEPMKQIFDENRLDDIIAAWLGGQMYSQDDLEREYHESQLMAKGRKPSKISYFVGWRNWTDTDSVLFNSVSVDISKIFLERNKAEFERFVRFCDDLVCLFRPAHAELYDYISSIECTSTHNAFIPDRLDIRCPALKWRTYFGPPYIELLGREVILNAPCWKTEEIGETIVLQLTETVFEEIPQELRQNVVDYFEQSVDPQIRSNLGTGFIFRPFSAAEQYSKRKKLVPVFPVQEMFGKNLDLEKVAKMLRRY